MYVHVEINQSKWQTIDQRNHVGNLERDFSLKESSVYGSIMSRLFSVRVANGKPSIKEVMWAILNRIFPSKNPLCMVQLCADFFCENW